jgi:hypothetical protein
MIHRLEQGEVLSLSPKSYVFVKLPENKKPEQLNQLINYWTDKTIILSCVEDYRYFSVDDLLIYRQRSFILC